MSKKLLVLFFIVLGIASNFGHAFAQDSVTLTVSGVADTKDEATKQALRSAIEQAYGAFVSSNTSILNDELVKDEIVTISQGNIQNFQEISSIVLPSGKVNVTVQATVSLKRLTAYAQSVGASVELAGATFGANMRLYELNKINELEAIRNLQEILVSSSPAFSYKVQIEGPIANSHYSGVKGYLVKIRAQLIPNEYTESLFSTFYRTLRSLSISNNERNNYDKMGIEYYPYADDNDNSPGQRLKGPDDLIYLRNDNRTHAEVAPLLFGLDASKRLESYGGSYMGFAHMFTISEVLKESIKKLTVADNLSYPQSSPLIANSSISLGNENHQAEVSKDGTSRLNKRKPYGNGEAYVEFIIDIPKEEISKYNNFQVIEKQ